MSSPTNTLDAENWDLLQELFDLAEATPAADRERVLAARCPDEAICKRAITLFEASQAGAGPARVDTSFAGKIGPYTLIRPIGAGGIGAVYLVERLTGGVVQRAAMKVLAPHSTGPQFIERFHREQHIMASLEHLNITRMLDAGVTEQGQPYLVMEYVDGAHLDQYCDQHKLDIRDRLRLFLHVCEAVAYAHRNLIVHLDLKPSNILVSTDGTVKLLDFGTSKLIQPDSRFTTTVMASPAYASPEQLRNEPVTTACDVYSLGGILFELLAGSRSTKSASVAIMIERAMREQEPEHLPHAVNAAAAELRGISESRLRQMLTGDLATITQKCLRPRPKDRYHSVDLLAQDIDRYLDGRPVLVRPQTILYRLGKFVRRNRRLVTVGAIAVVLLAAALGYAEIKQRRAIEEGRRAEEMQSFMYTLLRLANSGFNGQHNPTVADFLHLGAKALPQYIKDPTDLRAAQLSLARSLAENDDIADAQTLYLDAQKSAEASGDVNAQTDAETHLGEIAYIKGDSDKGATLTAHALALSRDSRVTPLVKADSETYFAFYRDNLGFRSNEDIRLLKDAIELKRNSGQPPVELGKSLRVLADDFADRSQPDQAEPYYLEAQQVYGNDPALLCERAQVEDGLSYVTGKRGNLKSAVEIGQKAYDDMSQCAGPESHQAAYEGSNLAGLLLRVGRNQDALNLMQKIVPLWQKFGGDSTDYSDSLRVLAKAELNTGHLPEAEANVKKAIAIRVGKTQPDHPVFGVLYLIYAEVLVAEHRDQEALPQAVAADRILKAAAADAPALKPYSDESSQVLAALQKRTASASNRNPS